MWEQDKETGYWFRVPEGNNLVRIIDRKEENMEERNVVYSPYPIEGDPIVRIENEIMERLPEVEPYTYTPPPQKHIKKAPSSNYKYFLNDPKFDGFEYFVTGQERDKRAEYLVKDMMENESEEDLDYFYVGVITHWGNSSNGELEEIM